MSRSLTRPFPRGSTLLLVMILLAVLSLVGVAAISIAEQDRVNVAAAGIRDMQVACAQAAQMVVYSELAKFGSSYLTSATPIPTVTMPDGTQLAHAHYDTLPGVTVESITPQYALPVSSNPLSAGTGNLSNRFTNPGSGTVPAYRVVALCTDTHNPPRKLEVEFMIAFSL